MRHSSLRPCLAALLVLLTSCGDQIVESEPQDEVEDDFRVAVAFVSGVDQSGPAGEELPNPLVVKVTKSGRGNQGVPNFLVNFRVIVGGGSMFAGSALTDAHGVAQDYWTLGAAPGENRLEVRSVNPTTGEKQVFGTFTAVGIGTSTTWFQDADADGFGDIGVSVVQVEQPAGFVSNSDDCDDNNERRHPGAAEIADGLDNDCDGVIPSGETDDDGDQYIESAIDQGGYNGPGSVVGGGDCDDSDNTVFPGAPELADGKDNDCDGQIDEGLSTQVITQVSITPDPATSADDLTCTISVSDQDAHDFTYRWFSEVTTLIQQETTQGELQNVLPAGSTAPGDEIRCDVAADADVAVSSAPVVIDGGGAAVEWYVDADLDTFGGPFFILAVEQPEGTVANSLDCDDTDYTVFPGAAELADGIDNDCDGLLSPMEVDGDGDTFIEAEIDGGGWDGAASVGGGGDCDDSDATVYPGAPELADGKDNDCDGLIDEGGVAAEMAYGSGVEAVLPPPGLWLV